jgi:hypothetical protein
MSSELWIIEAREPDGTLDLRTLQPDALFGMQCYKGIDEDKMAKIIMRHSPLVELDGRDIPSWPARLHPKWVARRKTW